MNELLIYADDLTGGNATAALCARADQPSLTVCDRSLLAGHLPPATIVDTETRSADPVAAERTIRDLQRRIDPRSFRFVGLRIDSTLRGNWGVEIGALLRGPAPPDLVVVVPAYPAAGRVCRGGGVLVHGRPLTEAVAGLPGAPKTSSAVQILFDQLRIGPVPIVLSEIRAGPDHLTDRLTGLHAAGSRVVLCDATEPSDSEIIADAIGRLSIRVLPVDPGPVLGRLVSNPAAPPPSPPAGPPIVVYAGTRSDFCAAEIEAVRARRPATLVEIDTSRLPARTEAAARQAAERVAAACARADLIIVRPARGPIVPGLDRAIDRAFAAIARQVQVRSPRPPRGLIVTGGATALAVAKGLGAGGVIVEHEVRALVARGRLLGGTSSGLPVVTKGGLVPGLADAVESLLGA